MARGFKIADAYVELTVDRDALAKGVKDIPREVGPELDRSGKDMGSRLGKSLGDESTRQGNDAGGKLAVGMRMSLIRNSPLIVAAVGAALMAGAPAMLTAATGLFAGIGIVAAAQSEKVQSAWLGTWLHVKQGAIESASAIEPVLVRVAANVGDSFDRMRPRLEGAFTAAAPQIQVFADGILDLAENALPGMERAIERGMPVTQGFADFLAKTGTGLSDFFDRISTHGPAAGQVWSSLGDTMAALLPLLGELMAQGAELAADVLPLLSSSLGLVLKVATALGPALPAIVAGFAAMKIAQSVSGWVGGIGASLSAFAASGGVASGAASKVGSALSAVGKAAPIVGIGVGLVGAAFERGAQEMDAFSQRADAAYASLLKGGTAAEKARAELEFLRDASAKVGDSFGTFGSELPDRLADAEKHFHQLVQAMTPVDRATQLVEQRTNDLALAVGKYGAASPQAATASRDLTSAQLALEHAQSQLQMATEGVTAAMVEQANQALAAIDSGFAYRNSVDQLEDAQLALNEAIQAHGQESEEAQRAQLGLEEQTFRTAAAFGQQQADLSGLEAGTDAYNRVVQEQTLGALIELQKQAGPGMAAAIGQQIAALQAGGVNMNSNSAQAAALANQVRGLGIAVTQVPGQKYVQIDAPTGAQIQQLRDLGYVVQTLPNGVVYVSTSGVPQADAAINNAARNRTSTISVAYRQTGAALASGGMVHPLIKAAGGRIVGPGGPTEDRVPAIGPGGVPWALSNGEYVIKASSVNKYGPALMAAVNSGTASVAAPQRRMADGGETSRGGSSGNTYNVNIRGTWDFANPRAARAVAEKVRDALVSLEREQR